MILLPRQNLGNSRNNGFHIYIYISMFKLKLIGRENVVCEINALKIHIISAL